MISLGGLNKAGVLAALYNAARPQGLGFLQFDPNPMTQVEAETLLNRTTRFDYLKGRVMKVDLSKDAFDPRLYDRDNGDGAAHNAIEALRKTGQTNPAEIQAAHHVNTLAAAKEVKAHLGDQQRSERNDDGSMTIHLGLADVADKLGPAVDKAIE